MARFINMYVFYIHMAVKKIQSVNFTKIEIQIVKYVFKHYKDRYNARQLSRILNLNHANVNNLCAILVKKRLFVKEKIGNSAYFSFKYGDTLALKFMEYLLSLEENEFPKWMIVILDSLKEFNAYSYVGCVFGSSIKSKNFNDIDVLLIYEQKNTKEIENIKEKIRKTELIDKPIRYLEITKEDLKQNQDNQIFYNVISENLVYHNPQGYVKVIKDVSNR